MATALSSKDPTSVGRYDLVELLGKGGMGAVYRGVDRESKETVAVKILNTNLAENPRLHYRFAQEFKSASKLDHPNIVRALDFGLDGALTFLVMEYVAGHSLGKMITRHGKLPEGPAVRIITQVAQALQYAHKRRIIHRDVKPDNILVRPDGLTKLADFGLAKDFNNDQDLTKPASGLGTPHFMAPEQYEDAKNASVLCDVYSLGATLYCALTGKVPFQDVNQLHALAKKIKGGIPSVRELVPKVSEHADEAIRRAMSPVAADRPANCLNFVKLLQARTPTGAGEPLPAPDPDRRASVRYARNIGTTCVIDTGVVVGGPGAAEDWPAAVRDVSTGGVGLALARRFEPGTTFSLELDATEGLPARSFPVRVKRVQPEPLGHWFHGCEFVNPLSADDLKQLLGQVEPPAPTP
jgi:serine/threonine protein kinase